MLPVAFVTEWKYRIVPPPGYQAITVPESQETELGPSKPAKKLAVAGDGSVDATLRFEISRRRMTPEEYETMREKTTA